MGALTYFMHTTLDNRISTEDGTFWSPFAWGEPEMRYNNYLFRAAGTWVFGRVTYEAIVPWWEGVVRGDVPADAGDLTAADHDFAALQHGMAKIVLSRSFEPHDDVSVIRDDVPNQLAEVKHRTDRDIILSCGPGTLEPLAAIPGLIDRYVLPVHPVVLGHGPRLFSTKDAGVALELLSAEAFQGGCIVLHYKAGERVDTARIVDQ